MARLTKWALALEIEDLGKQLNLHPCSSSRLMTLNYPYFSISELLDIRDRLVSQLASR